jgi:protein-S-isoprenylcysteine O-methyltransferase
MNHADTIYRLQQWTGFLWLALVAVWFVGAFSTKRTVQRQSGISRFWQSGIVLLGCYLLFGGVTRVQTLDRQLFPVTPAIALAGFAIVLCGIAFSIWARLILGANWSGIITLKEDHTLVRRGPYRIVRHPIYTGLLVALLGSALQYGEVRSMLAVPVCAFGFWLKSQTEERFMVQRFGDDYLRYQHEVRALLPFVF